MGISLKVSELTSRVVRAKIGDRTINPMSANSGSSAGGSGIISYVLSGIGSLGSFLVSAIGGFFSFSWSKLWSLIVATKQFLWNFNWNASDKNLDALINEKYKQIVTQAGGALGNALGWIFCGILPAATVMAFNEPLGAYLMRNVGEEAIEELADNFGALFKLIFAQGTQIAITWAYKSVRKLIKSNTPLVRKIFGKKIEAAVKAWGGEDSKPWSFATAYENQLEQIPNAMIRDALEEFGEEFDEACTEAGYVVANSVDSFYAEKMLEKQQFPVLGEMRYVEITPNRKNENEKIILGGNEELLKPVIIQTLATHQQLGERSVGNIYGTSDNLPVRSVKPEVVLKFYQARKDRIIGKDANGKDVADPNPLEMKISFRLMNKDETHFQQTKYAEELGAKIYAKFGKPPFKINKGKQLYIYADFAKGYQLQLWVNSQAEARRIVEQVLDIQGHSVDDEKLRIGSKSVVPKKAKEKVLVMGKIEEVFTTGNKEGLVTFTHAYVNVGNGTQPINLTDLTGRRRNVAFKIP